MIGSLYEKLANRQAEKDEAGAEEEARGPKGVKTQGPQKFRHITNGQIRRAERRAINAQQRKQTKGYRRRWLANEQAVAALRGQLQVVGALPLHDGTYVEKGNPFIVHELDKRYGSTEKALELYESVMDERSGK